MSVCIFALGAQAHAMGGSGPACSQVPINVSSWKEFQKYSRNLFALPIRLHLPVQAPLSSLSQPLLFLQSEGLKLGLCFISVSWKIIALPYYRAVLK